MLPNQMFRTIAIDFDGTIQDNGRLLDGALETAYELCRRGYSIAVFTARSSLTEVVEFLNAANYPATFVTNGKPQADIYVDDKAIHHRNWTDTTLELRERLDMMESLDPTRPV